MRIQSLPVTSTKIGVDSHRCSNIARALSLPVKAAQSAGVTACTSAMRVRKPACSGVRRANSDSTK
jgi:hypothetical protein